jgi:pimeloyl-ACP methyl ester carboxylesterase
MTQTPRTDEARAIVAERIKALLSFDGREAASSLTMPVLVLGAQDDAIVPLPLQQILADALPHARLAIIESGGHFFPIPRVQDTVSLLTAFIAQQDG